MRQIKCAFKVDDVPCRWIFTARDSSSSSRQLSTLTPDSVIGLSQTGELPRQGAALSRVVSTEAKRPRLRAYPISSPTVRHTATIVIGGGALFLTPARHERVSDQQTRNQRERNGVGKTNESGMVGCLCCGCAICVSSSHYEIFSNVESHHRYDRFDSEVKRMASNQKLDDDAEFNEDRLKDPDVFGRRESQAGMEGGERYSRSETKG